MRKRRFFGTDGIRGAVGIEPLTPAWVMHLGWALGKMLCDRGHVGEKVIIGKDSRISGYMFEYAMVSGLSAAGIDAHLLGVMPTPSIAYFTRTFHAAAGVVISASHNEYTDNGIKIFAHGGWKLPDDEEDEIERYLEQAMQVVDSSQMGKAYRIDEARGRYIEFCKNSIPMGLPFHRLKIVLDCANGATYAIAPNVFRELGARVTVTNAEPNGCNINAGCGSTHPDSLQRRVREEQADLGIAFDGDGDRVLFVDAFGRKVEGDLLLYAIAQYRAFKGEALSDVVGTVMTNLGVEHAFQKLGLRFHRAAVGDRYVLERLQALGAKIGGEQSGHIICLDRNSTGDGIIAALQVCAAVLEMGVPLHEIVGQVQLTKQVNTAVKVKNKAVLQKERVQEALQKLEAQLKDSGRMVVRPSGTEPKIRIMIEGGDEALATAWAKDLEQLIREEDDV